MKITKAGKKRILLFCITTLTLVIFKIYLDHLNSNLFSTKFTDVNAKKIVLFEKFCLWIPSNCTFEKMSLNCTNDNFSLRIETSAEIPKDLNSYKPFINLNSYQSYIVKPDEILYLGGKNSFRVFFNESKNYKINNIIVDCNSEYLLKIKN